MPVFAFCYLPAESPVKLDGRFNAGNPFRNLGIGLAKIYSRFHGPSFADPDGVHPVDSVTMGEMLVETKFKLDEYG